MCCMQAYWHPVLRRNCPAVTQVACFRPWPNGQSLCTLHWHCSLLWQQQPQGRVQPVLCGPVPLLTAWWLLHLQPLLQQQGQQ